MSLVIDSYGGSGGVGDVIAIVDRDGERAQSIDGPWQQALMRSMRVGSAGVVVLVSGYAPYLPHVGTSPAVFDSRGLVRSFSAPAREAPSEGTRTTTRQAVLRMSSADQAREVMAALNLNKTQLADVLGVSRPTLYDWLDGKEPNASNAQRLTTLLRLLASAGVTSASPLSPRFLRQSLSEGGTPLLEALSAESIDEQLVSSLVREAKALGEEAESRRVSREDRLRALGFEEPSEEQRREQLARNVAMRDWPKS